MNLRTERVGNITLASDYWECACDKNYIHAYTDKHCPRCDVWSVNAPDARADEVAEANAHLIAAAPDMYEALEYSLVYLAGRMRGAENGNIDRALHLIRKAVRKARGQMTAEQENE